MQSCNDINGKLRIPSWAHSHRRRHITITSVTCCSTYRFFVVPYKCVAFTILCPSENQRALDILDVDEDPCLVGRWLQERAKEQEEQHQRTNETGAGILCLKREEGNAFSNSRAVQSSKATTAQP